MEDSQKSGKFAQFLDVYNKEQEDIKNRPATEMNQATEHSIAP